MSSFPRTPQTLKAGIVVLDPVSLKQQRVIVLQYTPDQLQRTLQVQSTTGEAADRSEVLRLKGPPVETFKLEAEIDATDQLEKPDSNAVATGFGVFPQLAALESLITPSSQDIASAGSLLGQGAVEIAPMEAPIALFVWSAQRVVPVRITEFSITEEAFDVSLNPIRAKVSLSLRVLSVNDLGYNHPAAGLFLSYLSNKEDLNKRASQGSRAQLGLPES